jgi:hypothetical protein
MLEVPGGVQTLAEMTAGGRHSDDMRPAKLRGLPGVATYMYQKVHPTEVVIPRSFFAAGTGGRVS